MPLIPELWIHYDGYGDIYYFPWSYDNTITNYGTTVLNSAYSNIKSDLGSNNVAYDNPYSKNNRVTGGTLIDYALSLGALSVQASIGSQNTSASNIISTCSNNMDTAILFLSTFAEKLILTHVSSQTTMCTGVNCTQLATMNISYTIYNPSIVSRNVGIDLSLISTQVIAFDISFISINNTNNTWTSNYLFVLPQQTTASVEFTIGVTGNNVTAFDVSVSAIGHIEDAALNSALSFVSSDINNQTLSSSGSSNGLFIRNWYVSSTHHEGVAIGLVSVVFWAIIIIVLLIIFCLYKKDPGESPEQGSVSGYVYRPEVQVPRNEPVVVSAKSDNANWWNTC